MLHFVLGLTLIVMPSLVLAQQARPVPGAPPKPAAKPRTIAKPAANVEAVKPTGDSGVKPAAAQDPSVVHSQGFQYRLDPAPDWVVRLPLDVGQKRANGAGGVRQRLIDLQYSIAGSELHRYVHHAQEALDAGGLPRVSQLQIDFNPDYEKLVIHSLSLWRSGTRTDRTRDSRIDLLRREQDLEYSIYRGDVTASVLLSDVRLGDIIEVEFSVIGSNPIFGNTFATEIPIASNVTTDHYHFRMIHPSARKFATRQIRGAARPVLTERGDGLSEIGIDARDLKAVAEDQDRPRWFQPYPSIQITEFQQWKDVSGWADQLFEVNEPLSPELLARIEEIRAGGGSERDMIRRALKFVQEEVRYFGIVLRDNSHRPSPPNVTMARRFGDCKDKSLLLATIINQLGGKASPALVSFYLGRAVADRLPSPKIFDHVITLVELDGQRYWLDATRNGQAGDLDSLGFLDFGSALVIGKGATALDDVMPPKGYVNSIHVTEIFDIRSFKDPAVLTVETAYRGERADRMRAWRAAMPREETDRLLSSDVLRRYPGGTVTGPVEERDNQATNEFVLVEHYRIEKLLDYEAYQIRVTQFPGTVAAFLDPPKSVARDTPIALSFPLQVRQDVSFKLPENAPSRVPPAADRRNGYFTLQRLVQTAGKTLKVSYDMRMLVDNVPPNALSRYVDEVQKSRELLGIRFAIPVSTVPKPAMDAYSEQRERAIRNPSASNVVEMLNGRKDFEVALSTADIDSGKLDSWQLASALSERAISYSQSGKFDRALADISQAIANDPGNPRYHVTRGEIHTYAQKLDEAIADFEMAEKTSGEGFLGLYSRGQARYYRSEFAAAAADFAEDLRRQSGERRFYPALWQFLAQSRAGQDAGATLTEDIAGLDMTVWPGPLAAMMIGRSTPEAVLKTAQNRDRSRELMQLCEAYFFIGQKLVIAGKPEEAKGYFRKARETNIRMYLEYTFSGVELARIEAARDGGR